MWSCTVLVVICFHFSIFVPLETTLPVIVVRITELWFAFILVSLFHWKQLSGELFTIGSVVICFHFSIFVPLETTLLGGKYNSILLWFAFILVSLFHWKQPCLLPSYHATVVICFHFSIFVPLETTEGKSIRKERELWFAFILVSLFHWKQLWI